ncbi:hypothetical protein [Coleofasciculus sp. FACHB-T130]|uniref:hypothetical protein n=1 Tax=Coleofasciculus sp. FACHB-T130 TaxID=2692792 RepID=UPI00168666D2|nr:hypothetical protein [Coleofasciculus sp. FACHB-T130]
MEKTGQGVPPNPTPAPSRSSWMSSIFYSPLSVEVEELGVRFQWILDPNARADAPLREREIGKPNR